MIGPGVGIGWRPEICGIIDRLDGLRFCEVIAESLPVRRRGVGVPDELRSLGVPVVPHGISLSLGGADGVEQHRIDHLARCADALGAPLVSEHVAFVRAGGLDAGHLLPVPRSAEALNVLVRNVRRTQECLPVPLAVENIAALFDWPDDEYSEGEFLAELVERTGVYLLLDIANVYANARNRGRHAGEELRRLPLERVAYCHVAGGSERGGTYHDTHTDPVPGEMLDLVRQWASGGAPAMMLERDGNYPPARELFAELDAIADAAGFGRVTGGAVWSPP
ncbi:endonuclease [Rhodococcus opacus]|nr:endonuclease [Rhodococcus opacus]